MKITWNSSMISDGSIFDKLKYVKLETALVVVVTGSFFANSASIIIYL